MTGFRRRYLYLLLLVLWCSFLYILLLPGIPIYKYSIVNIFSSIIFLIISFFLFRTYLSPKEVFWIVCFFFLLRIVFVNINPIGSNDIYRYIWDGKVQHNQINPYLYSPNNLGLKFLRSSDSVYSNLCFTHLKTIYFPFSEWIFFLGLAF